MTFNDARLHLPGFTVRLFLIRLFESRRIDGDSIDALLGLIETYYIEC